MVQNVRIADQISRVAPLGIRFRDASSGEVIGSGLKVILYRQAIPYQRIQVQSNAQGVYFWQNVPGLRDLEFGAGDTAYWDKISPRPYQIEVTDPRGQYLPGKFTAGMPQQGLFTLACDGQARPEALPAGDVVLFRAPSASIPAGHGVVRAELHDAGTTPTKPAAWSILEVSFSSQRKIWGMADEHGQVVITFPYPAPENGALTEVRLLDQEWKLALAAAYTRQEEVPEIPDLCQVMAQDAADIWEVLSQDKLEEATLAYGQELILRSKDPNDGTPLSSLFITPNGG